MNTLLDLLQDKPSDKDLISKISPKKKQLSTQDKKSRKLLQQLDDIESTVQLKLGKYKDDYIVITTYNELTEYLKDCTFLSLDTETTGLDPIINKIVGLCLYIPNKKACYVPINHIDRNGIRIEEQLNEREIYNALYPIFNSNCFVVMFNAKFDIRVLRNQCKLNNARCDWDCYIAARLLNENEESNALKKLHQKYVLDNKEDEFTFDELFKGITFDKVSIESAYLYASHDAIITYELYLFQKRWLNPDIEREDLRRIYYVFKNIEMPCIEYLADMEDNGIMFDFNKHKELSEKYHKLLEEQINKVYYEIHQYKDLIARYNSPKLSNPINLNSPTQIAILLYDILQVESVDRKNPRGTDADILEKIDLPLCKELIKYKTLSKLVSAFIDELPTYVNSKDNKIHCSINIYGAKTGRMSCQDPNLQQVPSHNKDIRQLFKSTDGYILMSSDFSQQEPRLMAEMCGDEKMINAYIDGKDLYAQIASIAFDTDYGNCLEFNPDGTTNPKGKERRTSAKSILLG